MALAMLRPVILRKSRQAARYDEALCSCEARGVGFVSGS